MNKKQKSCKNFIKRSAQKKGTNSKKTKNKKKELKIINKFRVKIKKLIESKISDK